LEVALHPVYKSVHRIHADGTLGACLLNARKYFGSVKGLPSPVFLDYCRQYLFYSLVCGKPSPTPEALPAPPHDMGIFAQAGVDHLVFYVTAKRTFHVLYPSTSLTA
jgi:hypothetical protein